MTSCTLKVDLSEFRTKESVDDFFSNVLSEKYVDLRRVEVIDGRNNNDINNSGENDDTTSNVEQKQQADLLEHFLKRLSTVPLKFIKFLYFGKTIKINQQGTAKLIETIMEHFATISPKFVKVEFNQASLSAEALLYFIHFVHLKQQQQQDKKKEFPAIEIYNCAWLNETTTLTSFDFPSTVRIKVQGRARQKITKQSAIDLLAQCQQLSSTMNIRELDISKSWLSVEAFEHLLSLSKTTISQTKVGVSNCRLYGENDNNGNNAASSLKGMPGFITLGSGILQFRQFQIMSETEATIYANIIQHAIQSTSLLYLEFVSCHFHMNILEGLFAPVVLATATTPAHTSNNNSNNMVKKKYHCPVPEVEFKNSYFHYTDTYQELGETSLNNDSSFLDRIDWNLRDNSLHCGFNTREQRTTLQKLVIDYAPFAAITNLCFDNAALGRNIDDHSIKFPNIFGLIKQKDNLQSLSLQGSDMSNTQAKTLAECIRSNTTLEELNICYSVYVTDNAMKSFLDILKFDNMTLKQLHFDYIPEKDGKNDLTLRNNINYYLRLNRSGRKQSLQRLHRDDNTPSSLIPLFLEKGHGDLRSTHYIMQQILPLVIIELFNNSKIKPVTTTKRPREEE